MKDTISVILPDKSQKELSSGATAADLATSIGEGLARAALAAKLNGKLVDLGTPLHDGDNVSIITARDSEGVSLLRHSLAHVMAEAVSELFGPAHLGVGPAIEDGFYYDFEMEHQVTPDDLPAITKKMQEIIAADKPFVRRVISKEDAQKLFKDDSLKLELLSDIPEGEQISIYEHGEHVELCSGPHVPSAAKLPKDGFVLDNIAGAYWRGDAENQMLQRIYAHAFPNKKELKSYLALKEEAKKRDHRVLGPKLGLFELSEEVGPGLPLFLPHGATVVRTMQEWLRKELIRRGYEEVITPHIYRSGVWKTSGHYDFYKENMYFFEVNEGSEDAPRVSEFGVKPMNCPAHVLIYKMRLRSYRDLPLRLFEFGTVYRHELSGTVHGLFRARGFTQDDAHVFCRPDQVVSEVSAILDLVNHIMNTFGLTYSAEISTRPAHSIGSDEMWEQAENFLRTALEAQNLPFEINEGDGAFYGPKIDIKVQDSLKRTWQCSTIQVDFNMPERFDITYRTAENGTARPWMLHRAIFGSIERFLGILIEHYAGALPLWLAPVQAVVIPIADRHLDYAERVACELRSAGGRIEVASQNEPMRAKIAKAQEQKVPYMLVVGDKEAEQNAVSVRERTEGDLGQQSLQEFMRIIEEARV